MTFVMCFFMGPNLTGTQRFKYSDLEDPYSSGSGWYVTTPEEYAQKRELVSVGTGEFQAFGCSVPSGGPHLGTYDCGIDEILFRTRNVKNISLGLTNHSMVGAGVRDLPITRVFNHSGAPRPINVPGGGVASNVETSWNSANLDRFLSIDLDNPRNENKIIAARLMYYSPFYKLSSDPGPETVGRTYKMYHRFTCEY